MNKQQLLKIILNLRVWQRGDKRAPHKPLLLLIALSRIQHNQKRLVPFSDIEKKLTELLIEFGPQRKSYHSEEPFHRLPNDGLWELANNQGVINTVGKKFTKTSLRNEAIKGGFTAEIHSLLTSNYRLIEQIAHTLLETHFPQTIHQDITDAVGFDMEINYQQQTLQQKKSKRDPAFRG